MDGWMDGWLNELREWRNLWIEAMEKKGRMNDDLGNGGNESMREWRNDWSNEGVNG